MSNTLEMIVVNKGKTTLDVLPNASKSGRYPGFKEWYSRNENRSLDKKSANKKYNEMREMFWRSANVSLGAIIADGGHDCVKLTRNKRGVITAALQPKKSEKPSIKKERDELAVLVAKLQAENASLKLNQK